jgi:tRNA(fMet)-specific endonuclease VapC
MTKSFLALGLLAALAVPAKAQEGSPVGKPKLLLYGNYCGPGNNAPAAPVDALDAACARHDACTPDDGLPSKACNMRLQADAERVASDPRQPEDLRMMAGLVASGAAMMPSTSVARVGSPVSHALLASHRPAPASAVTDGE